MALSTTSIYHQHAYSDLTGLIGQLQCNELIDPLPLLQNLKFACHLLVPRNWSDPQSQSFSIRYNIKSEMILFFASYLFGRCVNLYWTVHSHQVPHRHGGRGLTQITCSATNSNFVWACITGQYYETRHWLHRLVIVLDCYRVALS